jgi:hypothetical protein
MRSLMFSASAGVAANATDKATHIADRTAQRRRFMMKPPCEKLFRARRYGKRSDCFLAPAGIIHNHGKVVNEAVCRAASRQRGTTLFYFKSHLP